MLPEKPFRIPAGLDDTNKKRKKVKVKVELPPIYEVVDKCRSTSVSVISLLVNSHEPLAVPDFIQFCEDFKVCCSSPTNIELCTVL